MAEPTEIVFVVEDDASVRRAVGSLVRLAGLRVQTFPSAQEFLAFPRPDVPSCLVLDVQLPGLSGLDLQEELAKGGRSDPDYFSHRSRRHSHDGAGDESRCAGVFSEAV